MELDVSEQPTQDPTGNLVQTVQMPLDGYLGTYPEIERHPLASFSKTLVDDEFYRVTYHQHPEDVISTENTLVVTFGTLQSDLAPSGFGTEYCLKNGYSTIYVATKRGVQYQKLSIEQLEQAIKPVIGQRRIVMYGSSLGAYAAVYFGGAFNADILAASPQCPAMPELLMKHGQTTPILHKSLLEVPRGTGRLVSFWDPHERADNILVTEFIKKIYPSGTYIEFPFAGHKVLDKMAKNGVINSYIKPLLKDMIPPELILPTDTCPVWNRNYGMWQFKQGNIKSALEHLQASHEIHPTPETIQAITKVYLKQKMREEALELRKKIESGTGMPKVLFDTSRKNLAALLDV